MVLGFVLERLVRQSTGKNDGYRYFRALVLAGIFFCISDIGAAFFRGTTYAFSRPVIYFFNIAYLESGCLLCFLWYRHTNIKFEKIKGVVKAERIINLMPLAFMSALALTTPLNGWLFTVNSENLYVRGPLIWLHWAVAFFYMTFPTLKALKLLFEEKKKTRRKIVYSMIIFVIAPCICCFVQMFIYGVSLLQLGYTSSILSIFLKMQNDLISKDGLTGLNNRGAFNNYMEDKLDPEEYRTVCLLMIDVDGFKAINDVYGHNEGDVALKIVAKTLIGTCEHFSERLFVARYGGDEFTIVLMGAAYPEAMAQKIAETANEELLKVTEKLSLPYPLRLSIGHCCGKTSDFSSVEQIVKIADNAMYKQKAQHKAIRLA